jgi:hypothetical protein
LVLHPVAEAFDDDGLGVVQQPVQDSRSQFVVKNRRPLFERLVGSLDDGATFIAEADHLKKKIGTVLISGQVLPDAILLELPARARPQARLPLDPSAQLLHLDPSLRLQQHIRKFRPLMPKKIHRQAVAGWRTGQLTNGAAASEIPKMVLSGLVGLALLSIPTVISFAAQ